MTLTGAMQARRGRAIPSSCAWYDLLCNHRWPDYISLNITSTFIPWLPHVFLGPNMTVNRYGNVFVGPGGWVGVPGTMGDARAGWIDQARVPSEKELDNFNSGGSVTASAYGAFLGGAAGPSAAEAWGMGGLNRSKQFRPVDSRIPEAAALRTLHLAS